MDNLYIGTVVSLKNRPRTISVLIESVRNHPKYHKTYVLKKKKQVHVKKNSNDGEDVILNLGDKVRIKSCRPYSATKRFLFIEKIS